MWQVLISQNWTRLRNNLIAANNKGAEASNSPQLALNLTHK